MGIQNSKLASKKSSLKSKEGISDFAEACEGSQQKNVERSGDSVIKVQANSETQSESCKEASELSAGASGDASAVSTELIKAFVGEFLDEAARALGDTSNFDGDENFEVVKKKWEKKISTSIGCEKMIKACSDASVLQKALFGSMKKDSSDKLTFKFLLVPLDIGDMGESVVGKVMMGIGQRISTYGLIHAGCQVGKWLIDWNDGSVAIPRPILKRHYPLVVDLSLASSLIVLNTPENQMNICKTIVKWNTGTKYSKTKSNCQHFADDLISSVNLDPRKIFKGEIGKFLAHIKKDPSSAYEPFYINEKDEIIRFKTHGQLDDHVRELELVEGGKLVDDDRRNLFTLLKRGFWLAFSVCGKRKFKQKNCPFGMITTE